MSVWSDRNHRLERALAHLVGRRNTATVTSRSAMSTATSSDRPRILMIGVKATEVAAIRDRFPSSVLVNDIESVAITDYDMLVTRSHASAFQASEEINVLHLGTSGIFPDALASYSDDGQCWWALVVPGTKSQRYELGPAVPASIVALLPECVDAARRIAAESNGLPRLAMLNNLIGEMSGAEELAQLQPFLTSSDDFVVAGAIASASGKQVWFTPCGADIVAWVCAAVNEWSETDPAAFPPTHSAVEWWRSDDWESSHERAARDRISALDAAHQLIVADHLTQREVLVTDLEATSTVIDIGERRLLTAQGDELVAAVIDALTRFGFDVSNHDEAAKGGDLLEDLRIVDSAYPEQVVIGEVRSYSKGGGKATDLSGKIRRFRERFITAEGHPPHASWYIANQTLSVDPAARPKLLASAQEDIDTFAEFADGLVIDTVQLYRVLRKLDRGEVDLPSFRAKMMTARGRWSPAEVD